MPYTRLYNESLKSQNEIPLAEITREALQVLYREIGVVNIIRFVNQFTTGYGDYTEERKTLFADMTLDDLLTEMSKTKQKPSKRK
jgi:hypothetical protein